MIPALLLLAPAYQTHNFNLYRGAAIAMPRYWDVEDTFLDETQPDVPNGGSYTLSGGKGSTILIRFGDLNRIVGPNKKITRATLYLTPSGGEAPVVTTAGRVLKSWGQGPRTAIANLFNKPKLGEKVIPPHLAATYRARFEGLDGWQRPGAQGQDDVQPIGSPHLDTAGKEFAVTGIEAAVQAMVDKPATNFGFALRFSSACEFYSSKSPEGRPRLEIECVDAPPATGADLSVISITSTPPAPRDGEQVTYTATVKNVGTAASKGFSSYWVEDDRAEKAGDGPASLAPGATTTLTTQQKFEGMAADHRGHRIGLRIVPDGSDASAANDELDIYESAMPVDFLVKPDAAQKLTSGQNYIGSKSVEDWLQAQITIWNETYAAQSFFSFAPEGALQRIRLNSVSMGDGNGVVVDGSADPAAADVPLQKAISVSLGMLDGHLMNVQPGSVQVPGSTTRACQDLYPGLMGYGDTRFDGNIPGALPMQYVPVVDPHLTDTYLEPTDLFAATDVWGLNRHLADKPATPSANLQPMPKGVILTALDMAGRAIPNADLLFFQSSNGSFAGANPAFTLQTNKSGLAVISSKGSGGPFGDLTPDVGNGVFLVQAKANGVLETGWVKAWEVAEAAARGAFTLELRLDLPDTPIDAGSDLAPDRIITDSANGLPAQLAPLIDDDAATEAALPDAKDSWVEIDLGRDRTVGEIDLVPGKTSFWSQFDIVVYGTGQRPADATPWAHEIDWPWTVTNRSDPGKTPNSAMVAYRGASQRVRYVRIVNRSGGAGTLADIRVVAAKAAQ